MKNRLILASKSPRRYDLLKQMGLNFEVFPSTVEEVFAQAESPREHVVRLAEAKALDVGNRFPENWVIGADTIVYVDGIILGKPKSRKEALEMLRLISGLFSGQYPVLVHIFGAIREGIFGLVIILFLVFEPDGLAARWKTIQSYWKLWPFSY